MIAVFFGLAVVPALFDGPITVLRWPALLVTFGLAVSLLYQRAPSRDAAEWRWANPGAVLATVIWILGSAAFSMYVSRFSSYGETYGSLGAVVVLLLWLFVTAAAVLLGAELNAELERQTTYDTTEGRDRPMGSRDAEAADTIGPTAEEVRAQSEERKRRANA